MGKHILSQVEGFQKRGGEIYLVDPNCIKVVTGWNDRIDFSGEEELMGVIRESGVPVPLLVKKNKNNELELRDGERRLRAVKRLISEGLEIKSIPVTVADKNINDIDLYLKSLVLNNGRPLSPIEQANSFKRLLAYNLSKQEIANKAGVSLSTVRNRLNLSNAIPAVKEAVKNNEISIKQATEIIEETDGGVVEQIEKLEVKKATPRTRTKKPVITEYNDDALCKSINCPRLDTPSIGQSDCRYHGNACIMTAKELLEFLKKEGYKITKSTTA